MASWQFALQLAKEEMVQNSGPHTVPQALILNEECLNGDTSLSGSIKWNASSSTYEVYNVNTLIGREGLVEASQVEDALFDLDIANSDWYGIETERSSQ